jgi:hypothetical protein
MVLVATPAREQDGKDLPTQTLKLPCDKTWVLGRNPVYV